MTQYGFHLETLTIRGKGKKDATAEFKGGLNVISGPSNTGKSFIFNCIRYLCGIGTPPKPIDEAKGYEWVYLVIRPKVGSRLTFERALTGGSFRMFEGGLEAVKASEGEVISEEHSAVTDDNISAVLLKLSGLRGKTLRTNASGETRPISFWDVAKFVLVNEIRIVEEASPILTEKLFWSPEKTTFKLLLTGQDTGGVIVKKTSKVATAQRQGQLQLVDELIAQTESELSGLTLDSTGVEEQAQKADTALEELTQSAAEVQAEISYNEQVRRTSYESIQQLDSRRLTIRELLSRFDLLRDRYNSDLARLESIREANRLFFEASPQPCPVCGADGQPLEGVSQGQIEAACNQEIRKIRVLLTDLAQTTSQLDAERRELEQRRGVHASTFETASKHIQSVLVPRTQRAQSEIHQLLETRRRLERAKQVIDQLTNLKAKKATLSAPVVKQAKDIKAAEPRTNETVGLCREVETLLNDWHYPDAGPVLFSELDQDILIDGRQRKGPGKGFRALSYSAFIIGIMKHCYRNALPHPGFVVLDSPLVAYKDPDVGDEGIRQNNVKDAFYRALAMTPLDEQIIIMENQDPPPDVIPQIHHIHFSRLHGVNRYGFFPVTAPASDVGAG